MSGSKDQVAVQASGAGANVPPSPKDASVSVVQSPAADDNHEAPAPADQVDEEKKGFLAFFKTKEFYIILLLG